MNTTPPNIARPPKVAMASIVIAPDEGPFADEPKTTHTTWAGANARLVALCQQAPKDGQYHKCPFVVTWADGETYQGRYDAAHPHSPNHEIACLERRIQDYLTFRAGLRCPQHMTAEEYDKAMAKHPQNIKDEAVAFLSKYALKDEPKPAAPVDTKPTPAEPFTFYRRAQTAGKIALAIQGIATILRELEQGAEQLRDRGDTKESAKTLQQAINTRKALAAMIAARSED